MYNSVDTLAKANLNQFLEEQTIHLLSGLTNVTMFYRFFITSKTNCKPYHLCR